MLKATVAIEDHRFYEHGGVDYQGIARAACERPPRRRGRPGRLDDHAAARAQPLHLEGADVQAQGQGGLPRDQAEPPLVEGQDPRRVRQPGLLRQPRLRDRGRGADVLLEARARALARTGGDAGRPPAGAVELRPAAPALERDRAARRGVARDAQLRVHHARPVQGGDRGPGPAPQAGQALHAHQGAVLLQLRARPADRRVRVEHGPLGRAARLHDDQPASPGGGREGDPRHALPAERPGGRSRLDQPRERRDPGDDGGDARPDRQPVQPRRAGEAAARLDVQDLRPHGRDRAGDEPEHDLLHLRAVPLPAGSVHARLGRLRRTTTRTRARSPSRARRCAPTTRSTPS